MRFCLSSQAFRMVASCRPRPRSTNWALRVGHPDREPILRRGQRRKVADGHGVHDNPQEASFYVAASNHTPGP